MASSSLTELVSEDEGEEVKAEDDRAEEKPPPRRLVLRLEPRRHISFTADTIDNEHMNKKSSKRCCIYHKQRARRIGASA